MTPRLRFKPSSQTLWGPAGPLVYQHSHVTSAAAVVAVGWFWTSPNSRGNHRTLRLWATFPTVLSSTKSSEQFVTSLVQSVQGAIGSGPRAMGLATLNSTLSTSSSLRLELRVDGCWLAVNRTRFV